MSPPDKATAAALQAPELQKDVIQKVKNTFLEFGEEDEAGYWKRRSRSLDDDPKVSLRGAVEAPLVQGDNKQVELYKEDASESTGDSSGREALQSAYIVPTTPSPFLHAAAPPFNSSAVPAFGAFGSDYELGLPPACEQDGELRMEDGMIVPCMDMEGMPFQGMHFLPEMCQYDPNFNQFMGYAWSAMPVDDEGNAAVGIMESPQDCGVQGSACDQAANTDRSTDHANQKDGRRRKGSKHEQECSDKRSIDQDTGDVGDAEPEEEMCFGSFGAEVQGREPGLDEGYAVQPADVDAMPFQGMQFVPEMYDSNYGQYVGFAWGAMPMDAQSDAQAGGGALEDPNATAAQGVQGQAGVDGARGRKGDANQRVDQSGADGAAERAGHKEGRRGKGRRDGREEERQERPPRGSDRGSGGQAAGDTSGPAEKAKPRHHGHEEDERPADYTTVMLRNIPNKYTREMLTKQLSLSFNGEFDFMYLPIDFKNKCNVGYSFINFRNQDACERFVAQFHGVDVRKCLPGLNSKKVVEVTPARVQGLSENVRRLRNSPVMNQLQDHPEWMPLIFNEHGEESPFPTPDQPLPPVKARGRNRDSYAGAYAGE